MIVAPVFTSFLPRWFWHLCYCLLLPAIAPAQPDWQVYTSANAIAIHEQVTISYKLINATGTGVQFTAFTDWDVLSGPMISTSTSIINGKKTTTQQYSFQLAPRHTGECHIPAASIIVNGKRYQTNSLVIEVTQNGRQNNTPYPPNEHGFSYDAFVLDSKEDAQEKIKRNLMLRIRLSKNSCFEGESIVANYELYSRVNLNAELDKRPGFEGFSTIDIPNDNDVNEFRYATENGKVFKVYTLRKVQLTALRSGILTLAPMSISGTVSFLRTHNGLPIAQDPYLQPQANSEVPFSLTGSSVAVNVKPLPAKGKPATGAIPVGEFSYTVQMPKQPLAAGDAAELIVAVSGLGQWSMLQAPAIEWPKGITGFEPRMDEQLDSQRVPVQGVRRYIYRFTADSMGDYTVRIKGFHFFNPAEVAYKQTADSTLHLHIAAAVVRSPFADDPINDPDSFQLTAWFTRFMPLIALSAALLLVIVLMLRGKARRNKKHTAILPDSIYPHSFDDPLYQVHQPVNTQPQQTTASNPVEEKNIPTSGTDIKTLATHIKNELARAADSQGTSSQVHLQLLQVCNDVLYSPFGHEHSIESLQQLYAEWQQLKG